MYYTYFNWALSWIKLCAKFFIEVIQSMGFSLLTDWVQVFSTYYLCDLMQVADTSLTCNAFFCDTGGRLLTIGPRGACSSPLSLTILEGCVISITGSLYLIHFHGNCLSSIALGEREWTTPFPFYRVYTHIKPQRRLNLALSPDFHRRLLCLRRESLRNTGPGPYT